MPGLAGRMSTVIKAKISKLLDRAEDPGETLDYGYQKQIEYLQNVKKGIADVVTSKKRLQMQSSKLEQSIVKLDTQARQALAQGREDLARTALERKTLAQNELQSLDQQVAELEKQQESLTENERRMREKIEAFRTKKEVIKAQYSAAEAQVQISEAANGVGEQMADLGLAIQRAEEKTEDMKARANAVDELEKAGTFEDLTELGSGGSDDIDRQLAQISAGQQVDDELAKVAAGRRRSSKARVRAHIRARGSDRPHSGRGPVRGLGRRRHAAQRTRQSSGVGRRGRRRGGLRGRFPPDDPTNRERRLAAAGRFACRLGRDSAAAGHHFRRGQGRVHRRGPDPRLTAGVSRSVLATRT